MHMILNNFTSLAFIEGKEKGRERKKRKTKRRKSSSGGKMGKRREGGMSRGNWREGKNERKFRERKRIK